MTTAISRDELRERRARVHEFLDHSSQQTPPWLWEHLSPHCFRAQNSRGLSLLVWPGTLRAALRLPGGIEQHRSFNSLRELLLAVADVRKHGARANWTTVESTDE